MKSADRIAMIALPVLVLVAVFWFVLLSPKRQEASDLKHEVDKLQAAVAEQEETIAFAEEARGQFGGDYRRLVTLGKAVPEDDDTSSLFAQVGGISRQAGVQFRALELSESAASATAPPPPPPPDEGSVQGEQQAASEVPGEGGTALSATGTAAATESAAASLPIGAAVGPAGLPVMPYTLGFQGDFFRMADFMGGLDSLVSLRGPRVRVRGRLLTIDGFVLSRDLRLGFPSLLATLAVTTYVTPATQGLTGGSTPSGPASPPPPSAVPASGAATTPPASGTATTPPASAAAEPTTEPASTPTATEAATP